MQITPGTLTAFVIAVATVLSVLHVPPDAHANGSPAFTLRNFDYDRAADLEPTGYGGYDWVNINIWRVTVCTPRPARLRIRAIVDYRLANRFVRRQPAGCTRHRMRAESDDDLEFTLESRLRVAWRNYRQRTPWQEAGNPAPD